MKKVIVGLVLAAVLVYLISKGRSREGLLYAGPHCADQRYNCAEADPTGVCTKCIHDPSNASAPDSDRKFNYPYGKQNPYYTPKGQLSSASGGVGAIGCQVNPGESVDKYIARVGAARALGAKGDPDVYNCSRGGCGDGSDCYNRCTFRSPADYIRFDWDYFKPTTSPWEDVAGRCYAQGRLWAPDGRLVNECKNGFKPVVRSAKYVDRQGCGGESVTPGREFDTYLCACQMTGAEMNRLVQLKKSDPNNTEFNGYTFDWSTVDELPPVDAAQVTLAGAIHFTQDFTTCRSYDCGKEVGSCPW